MRQTATKGRPPLEVLEVVHHNNCNKKPLVEGHRRILRKCLLLGRYAVPMDDEEYENKLANRKFLKLLVSRGLVENIGLQKHKHSPYHHGTPTFGITQKGVDSI